MRVTSLLLASAALLGLAAAAAPFSINPAAQAATGDFPEHTFRGPVWNGMGIGALADLRGKPVLVEFWGTR